MAGFCCNIAPVNAHMTFLYPQFLYALSFLAVPIIIHFFNLRRYKKVAFTNVQFLAKAQNVRRSFNQLRNWLILLFRLLAITCVVLAFAQPVSQEYLAQKGKNRTVSIYVDNSLSTSLKSAEGEVFAIEKDRAEKILSLYGKEDAFRFYHNQPGSGVSLLDQNGISEKLSLLNQSPFVQTLPQIIDRDRNQQANNPDLQVQHFYILSDFQRKTTQLDDIHLDSNSSNFLVPVQSSAVANISVDSAYSEQASVRQGEPLTLKAKLHNRGDASISQLSVKATCNNLQVAIATIDLEAKESKWVPLTFNVPKSGWNTMSISIEDYPVDFDNTFYLTFNVKEKIRILCLNQYSASKHLNAVYKTNPLFALENQKLDQVDYSALSDYEVIVLNGIAKATTGLGQQLTEVVAAGTNLVIIPSDSLNAEDFNAAFSPMGHKLVDVFKQSAEVKKMNLEHPFMEDVFEQVPDNPALPKTASHWNVQRTTPVYDDLLTYGNGNPFLSLTQPGAGHCFLLTSNISKASSNFAQYALFLPVFYKMALFGETGKLNGYFLDRGVIDLPLENYDDDQVLHLSLEDFSFIPKQQKTTGGVRIYTDGPVSEPGIYKVHQGDSDSALAWVGLNISRYESEMDFYSQEELAQWADQNGAKLLNAADDSFDASIKSETSGNNWWKWLLWLAVLCILLEILTIKLLHNAFAAKRR